MKIIGFFISFVLKKSRNCLIFLSFSPALNTLQRSVYLLIFSWRLSVPSAHSRARLSVPYNFPTWCWGRGYNGINISTTRFNKQIDNPFVGPSEDIWSEKRLEITLHHMAHITGANQKSLNCLCITGYVHMHHLT